MEKVKIKKNDQVVVIAGKDRGARGRVMRVFPTKGTALVERVNMMKRHTRANPTRQIKGGILEREAPIRLSKLMVVCSECGRPARIGRQRLEDGRGVRLCKRCRAMLS
jgi:large subunit ribosomal protein L24